MRLKENLSKNNIKLSETKNRLEIGYNPLVKLKKDLGYKTKRDIEDEKILRRNAETLSLESRYKGYKAFPGKDILDFCIHSEYVFIRLEDYKSELSDKCLETIQKFIEDNSIQFLKGYFWILCPKKFAVEGNTDYNNISHNIYYYPDYISYEKVYKTTFIEVYGSDFEEGSVSKKVYNILRYGIEDSGYVLYDSLPYASMIIAFLASLYALFFDEYEVVFFIMWISISIIVESIFYIVVCNYNELNLITKSKYYLNKYV